MVGIKRLLSGLAVILCFTASAQDQLFHFKIEGEINPAATRHVTGALKQASDLKATGIIAEINTFGGTVHDADEIRTLILECDVPVYAFINKNAASAGALISIACDSIYMAPGASIGAATVVISGTREAAPDKYQSYMRSLMRSTAQANHRNPAIAEGMVDQNLVMDSVIKKNGRVITFTTEEAIKFGYCEARVNSLKEIQKQIGLEKVIVKSYSPHWSEKVIAWFMNPAISGILVMLILAGIYYEMQAPGLGFPSLMAIIAALLYFIPYYLSGLAENWEILLFFIGLILIGVEIFVIPGFGFVGITGIALVVVSVFLVMVNNDFLDFTFVARKQLMLAGITSVIAVTGFIVLLFWAMGHLATSKRMAAISLQHTLESSKGYNIGESKEDKMGKRGVTLTELRPVGKVLLDGEVYSAIAYQGYIARDEEVEVTGKEINNLKVRKVQS